LALERKISRWIPQFRADTCWAAALEMWASTEGLAYWTQTNYMQMAANRLVWNPSNGADPDLLKDFIFDTVNLLNEVGALKLISFAEISKAEDLPDLNDVLSRIGTIFIAFKWPGKNMGHAVVLLGMDDTGNFFSADPDGSKKSVNPYSFYFSAIPALLAWKTPQQFGL
jgi:Papain-like cysteine protease AvrRpt2